jgi:hypothetical protein
LTKFDEMRDILGGNKSKKNRNKKTDEDSEEIELEVSGLSPGSGNPMAAWASEETDPDMIEMLYRSYRSRPLMGEGADSWDST